MILCQTCHVELGPGEDHMAHEHGCEGETCTCDLVVCADCCPQCHPCTRCSGNGWITAGADSDPMWECPECFGTGNDPRPPSPWPDRIDFAGPVPLWVYERDVLASLDVYEVLDLAELLEVLA